MYENIKLEYPNMACVDGYFYNMDHSLGILRQKVSGGSTACSYPLDNLLSDQVNDLEYDGVNFWSINYGGGGVNVRRWKIEDNVCKMKDSFNIVSVASTAFAVESYDTTLASGVVVSGTLVKLSNYSSLVESGMTLSFENETVSVDTVSGSNITLSSGVTYSHNLGDSVNFYKNLWVFDGNSGGRLHKIDAYTGSTITTYNNSEYSGIHGATFAYITNGFSSNVNALIYVKNTNLKYLNINTMTFYGVATIDNLKADNTTEISVYDLCIDRSNVYRLQNEACYYGSNYSWSSYNYVLSTTRRFVDTISVSAYPVILPANGTNTTEVTAIVNDQYGDGIIYKPVSFTDDDDDGFITINPAYTDLFFGTGSAYTYYKAGLVPRTVTIEGTATQYD